MRETESLNYGMTFDPYPYLTLYLKQKDRTNWNHKWLRCLLKPYSVIYGSIDDVARLFVNVKVTAFSYSKGFGLTWFNTHAYSQEAVVSSLAWLLEVILNNDFQQKGDDDLTNDEYDQYDEYDKYDE
ncbi:hypothetical protein Tco_0759617 [Tanacetum coccineum]